MPELTVIFWRDIPAQVKATHGRASARAQLSDRFEKAIDAAAMRADLADADLYLAEWRQETRPCGEDLDSEVAAEVARLEDAYPQEMVRSMIRNGGLARAAGDGGGGSPSPPS